MRPKALLAVLLLATAGCNVIPKTIDVNDARVQPLLKAAATFPRESYGFTPLPKSGTVRLESRPTDQYDAMLHIDSKTKRTIAFRKAASGFKWTGEQETFTGPHRYKTADGTLNETIVLTYELENVSGVPLNRLQISYEGDRQELQWPKELKLSDVSQELHDWAQ